MVRLRINPRVLAMAVLAGVVVAAAWPAKKKSKDGQDNDDQEETQVLQLPKELPSTVVGETRRLTFYVTPLSAKGLLSQQVRTALRALDSQTQSDTVLEIRAFLAGSGDLRRVRDLISETFTDRHRPLPAVSIVQTGGLPLVGAQVVLEAVAEARKDRYPGGLAWISAQTALADDPQARVAPLAEKALARLREAIQAAGAPDRDVLRVTCFLSALDNLDSTRRIAAMAYPHAALDFVQTQREPLHATAACEAVAGLEGKASLRVRLLNPEGLPPAPGESQIAVVGSAHVLLTGSQASFGFEVSDARLAFTRLEKELQQEGLSPRDIAFARFYPLSEKMAGQVRQVRGEVFDPTHPPAGTLVLFEGLSSEDAGFAVDVVAAKD